MARIIYILFILFMSCKSINNITIYKDKETMTVNYHNNNINDFHWEFKKNNVFDTISLNKKQSKRLYKVIDDLEKKQSGKENMSAPRYAFILNYNNKKDTLYFSDFNYEDYEKKGFLIQNSLIVIDNKNMLKKFLLDNYKEFIQKEYYYLSDGKEEHDYQKDNNNDNIID